MPTYQYECAACGRNFEILQSMSDTKLKKCPHCAKNKLQRLIGTGAGLIFKGSGFYETDYKRKNSSFSSESKNEPKSTSPQKPVPGNSHGCGSGCGCSRN